jgi:hypothetical protein
MTLDALRQTRQKLQAEADAAAQAVQREQKKVDRDLFQLRECERTLESARDRAALDAAQAAVDSAAKDHNLALKRLADRKAEHTYAELQAETAQALVVKAVDQILTDEMSERAKQIAHHLDEARRLGIALRHFALAAGIHTTGGLIQAATEQVLVRLGEPLIDLREIPISLERLGDVPAFRGWLARRERMIAGETPAREDQAA